MDATSSNNGSESPGAGSSGSGSSPKRRSARLSGRVIPVNLQKQVLTKNFLEPQIKETPRTLLEAFASKKKDEASVVRSDKTLELTVSALDTTRVLEKSRERRKSFHEESFLLPVQQKSSLPSARKRRTDPDDAPVKKSPKKLTEVVAASRNWRRPKPIDHFLVKRQSKDTIEAAIVGESSSSGDVAARQNTNLVADPTDEEDKELEFTDASIDSTAISGTGFSGSRRDGAEKGEGADVEDLPSGAEKQRDMEADTPNVEAEKTMEHDTGSDIGTAKGEEASRKLGSHQKRAQESRSALISPDDLRTSEVGKTLSPQRSRSSARKSVTTSSRLSLAAQTSDVSDPRLRAPITTSSLQIPQLHPQVQRLSTPVSELSPRAQQLSLSMPKLSIVVEQLQVPVQQLQVPVQQLQVPVQQLHVPVQQLHVPVQQLQVPVRQSHSPAPQLSAVPEELSVTSRNELAMTSTAGVTVTSTGEVASIPAMEVVSTPTVEVAMTLTVQAPTTPVVDNAEVDEASMSASQVVEEEEEAREEAAEPTTPRLPWTPRLPPKARLPASERKSKQSAVVDIQPETSGGARPKSCAPGGASRGRQRGKRIQTTVPRSLSHAAFQFFAGMKVSKEALEEVDQISEVFWSNVLDDLEAYAKHGRRSVVERSDVELLMRRQRFVTENTSLNALIEKYLALEDRETLIPIARAGNRLE